MLIPLALISIAMVSAEVLIWRLNDFGSWIFWVYALINVLTMFVLLQFFFTMLTKNYYRLPRRATLVHDVSVPSLPPPSLQQGGNA
jgi:hypothetical protein